MYGIGGWDSVVGVATRYGLIGLGFEPRCGGIFRTHPNTPLIFLSSGPRMYFPVVKRSRLGADILPLSRAVVDYGWCYFPFIYTYLASV